MGSFIVQMSEELPPCSDPDFDRPILSLVDNFSLTGQLSIDHAIDLFRSSAYGRDLPAASDAGYLRSPLDIQAELALHQMPPTADPLPELTPASR